MTSAAQKRRSDGGVVNPAADDERDRVSLPDVAEESGEGQGGPQAPPALITIREAAGRLRVSESTVRNAVRQGRLRAFRFGVRGGSIRISPADLDDYMASCATSSPSPTRVANAANGTPFKNLDGPRLLAAWRRQGVLGDQPSEDSAPSSESRCGP